MTLEDINSELSIQQNKLEGIKEYISTLKKARLKYLPTREAFFLAYLDGDLKLLDCIPNKSEYPNTRQLISEWDYEDGEHVNILKVFDDYFVFLTDPEHYSKYRAFEVSSERKTFMDNVVAEMIQGGFYGFVNKL